MCILYNIGRSAPKQLRISGLCSPFGARSMFELEFCLRLQAWLRPVDVKRLDYMLYLGLERKVICPYM